MTRERMSGVDTAWLRMDTQSNLMMIVGVWLVEPALRYEALVERVAQLCAEYGRRPASVAEARALLQLAPAA